MSLRVRLGLLVLGLALAAGIVVHTGVDTLLGHLARAGWLVLPVSLVWAAIYTCNAAAWRLTLRREPRRPGFWRTWVISVSSFSLNHATPLFGVGGEAFRAAAVAPWIGGRKAVGSVVQYRLLHSLAHMLFVVSALVPGLLLLPRTPAMIALLVALGLAGALVAWFLHRRHREGVLEATLDLLLALPLVRRAARPLARRRDSLRQMDRQITVVYHQHPADFWRALALEYLSRWLMTLEPALVLIALGRGFRPAEAAVLMALSSTLTNLFFYVPMELGAREGVLLLAFTLLGFGGGAGVFAAVVTRLREMVWTLIGLGLLWAGVGRVPTTQPAPDSGLPGL
jgi:uncharacterized protein (TIRG00374 family)